jgi:hypothetical protein
MSFYSIDLLEEQITKMKIRIMHLETLVNEIHRLIHPGPCQVEVCPIAKLQWRYHNE